MSHIQRSIFRTRGTSSSLTVSPRVSNSSSPISFLRDRWVASCVTGVALLAGFSFDYLFSWALTLRAAI